MVPLFKGWTSNNEVAPFRNLTSVAFKNPLSNFNLVFSIDRIPSNPSFHLSTTPLFQLGRSPWLVLLFPLKYHSFKNACPGEVRGRNPEGVFFSDPWLRGTGKRGESRIKARNRGWKPLPQAVSYPSSRFWVLGSGFRVQGSKVIKYGGYQ